MSAPVGAMLVFVAAMGGQPSAQPTAKPAVQPATPSTGLDGALMARLEAIDAKAALIQDLTADFEQKKYTVLLKEPMASSGRVRVRGSVVRWDTAKPRESVVRIDEHEVRVYYPEDAALEIYTVDEQLRRLTASPIPRLQSTRDQFQITAMKPGEIEGGGGATDGPSAVALRLTPKEESLRKHVQEVRVLIDGATGVTLRLEMIEADGDRTVVAFLRARTNTGLGEHDLDLVVPPGASVSRPLEGLQPGPGGDGKK